MITFKLGALKLHGGRTGVVLQAQPAQRTIGKLNDLALLAPAIESPTTKALEIPKSARLPAPEKTERLYADGSSLERWKFWVSSLPLSFTLGLGFYLYFTGTPERLAGVVMLAGFVVFGLVGLLIEHQRLRAFVCPHCNAPIEEWDTNEKHRILFDCVRCESRWDIEYRRGPSLRIRRNRFRRTYLHALCSCRGAL